MPTFIDSCNCRGSRPLHVIGNRYVSRPDIVGLLLKDRHVSRFVIAPTGFGKSNLVYEYANIIFGFDHVFWIRCDSPCFLRDLDAGVFLTNLLTCGTNPELVVFEDVPTMDPFRSEAMSDLIDGLLEYDCEVIVTCTPSADTFSGLQRDRMTIRSKDLMVTENELVIEELRGGIGEDWRDRLRPNERVACNVWSDDGHVSLLQGLRAEDLPQEIKLSILIMLIGQSGLVDCLARFIPKEHVDEVTAYIEVNYPMMGVESRTKAYHCLDVEIPTIAMEFCSRIDEVVIASVFDDRDTLCCAVADWLLERFDIARACDFMETYATKLGSAKWLARRGWWMLSYLEALPCVVLHDATRRGATGCYDALSIVRAWGSYILDDSEQAWKYAKMLMRSTTARLEERICAAFLICLIDDDPSADEAMLLLSEAERMRAAGGALRDARDAIDWIEMASFACMEPSARMNRLISHHPDDMPIHRVDSKNAIVDDTFMMQMIWVMHNMAVGSSSKMNDAYGSEVVPDIVDPDEMLILIEMAKDAITVKQDRIDMCGFLLVGAMESLAAAFPKMAHSIAASHIDLISRQAKVKVFAQREEYKRYLVEGLETRLEYQRANPDVFRTNEAKQSDVLMKNNIPPLYVSLFGGLQVRIGDEIVDAKKLSRRKTKLLLAALVMNKGHEVSRSQIIEILWPEGDADSYRRNFYSVWSQLKKALTVNGSCPYLIRSQNGCRLDPRFLQSDLARFDELCRTLLFGSEGSVSWEMLYSQVNEEFADDLLPSLQDSIEINLLREKYRESLIDGLIATSTRLNSAGEPRGALWFAREAVRRNDKREDAYIALMEAQISSNQRGAALETYFSCRKFLSEELGIDPSVKVVELYRSIIECEEELP